MSDDTLIRVENVSKKFARRLRHAMWYGMCDLGREVAGLTSGGEALRTNEFWALRDVSFELKRGECLGIIGPNGAGKSTLLKLLNGIIRPTDGRVRIKGRVGALIEVGAGFHPMLTGRENIYINGAILGMTKAEIDRKFDAIVDFADIGDFLDTPVKFYSSGMYVRLGFAIAAHLEPDVLLIDEVLAVGDVAFRARCLRKCLEMLPSTAIVLITHTANDLFRCASHTIVVSEGRMSFAGEPTEAWGRYQAQNLRALPKEATEGGLSLLKCAVNGGDVARSGDPLCFEFHMEASQPFKDVQIGVAVTLQDGQHLVTEAHPAGDVPAGRFVVRVNWDRCPLAQGAYWLGCFGWAEDRSRLLFVDYNCLRMRVTEPGLDTTQLDGIVRMPFTWEFKRTNDGMS